MINNSSEINEHDLEQAYANATISNDAAEEESLSLPPELQQFVSKLFELARTGGSRLERKMFSPLSWRRT